MFVSSMIWYEFLFISLPSLLPNLSAIQSSAVDLKTKEEKDAELDKRIEALRKKNEALMKRYQVRGLMFS